jgi:hypothetical protein
MDLPARALGWSLFSFKRRCRDRPATVVVGRGFSTRGTARRATPPYGRQLATVGSVVVIAAGDVLVRAESVLSSMNIWSYWSTGHLVIVIWLLDFGPC